MLSKLLNAFIGNFNKVIKLLAWFSSGLLGLMGLIVAINVFGRYFLNKPLTGTVELVEVIMIIIAFFTIPYTQYLRRHVQVDLVISYLPPRFRSVLSRISFIICFSISAIITYQAIKFTISNAKNFDKCTFFFRIPHALLWFIMALGCIILCLKFLTDIFDPD